MTAATPLDHAIRPRDLAFGRDRTPGRWWLNGDPVASALFDALSVTFPQGERFFMDSVRRYRDAVSPELRTQIAGFLAQEALHSREHAAFNRHVGAHGRDLAAMEARTRRQLDETREKSPLVQLAATACMEHYTAILAQLLLNDPRLLHGADRETARMWRWHSIEEIEHKAVAYDTYLQMTAHLPARRRWLLRSLAMGRTTTRFFKAITLNLMQILREDGVDGVRTRLGIWRYLLWSPGLLRMAFLPWLRFFKPGFHPWDQDDRALLQDSERELTNPA